VPGSDLFEILCHYASGLIAAAAVVAGKLRDDDAGGGVGGVDKSAAADVDAHVSDIAAAGVEAEYIAGLDGGRLHVHAVGGLILSYTVEGVAELLVHIVHKAGAVKAGAGRAAAPAVAVAHKLQGVVCDLLPRGGYDWGADGKYYPPTVTPDPDEPEIPDEPDTPVEPEIKNGIYEENGDKYYYVNGVKQKGIGVVKLTDETGATFYIYVRTNGQLATGIYWPTVRNDLLPRGPYDWGTNGRYYPAV